MMENVGQFDSLVIELRDENGNIKPVFQESKLFRFLIINGIVSPNFPKIPYLLGRWQTFKEIIHGNS